MSVFFVYTGLEVGAGQWEASFCRGELHLSAGATGLAAFGYWGALTAVRIGLALLPRPSAAGRGPLGQRHRGARRGRRSGGGRTSPWP